PKLRRFRVAGIFYSGMYEYDAKLAYVSIKEAQKFFGKRGRASGVELKIEDIESSGLVVKSLELGLGGEPYRVKDWRDMNKELFSALLLEKMAMFVALAMIITVASFLIVATLVMIVLQRGREIAILKSMGASESSILKVFVVQGVVVGVGGALLGVALGVTICSLLQNVGLRLDERVFYIERLPVVVDGVEVAVIAISAMIITYLATIYPAMSAAVLRPVDGLREE
ncbi:MAG: FtsX-like permease family protein, partial [Myxococcota bacterium]